MPNGYNCKSDNAYELIHLFVSVLIITIFRCFLHKVFKSPALLSDSNNMSLLPGNSGTYQHNIETVLKQLTLYSVIYLYD